MLLKYGEDPQFGEPLPRKLLDVFDDSRDLSFAGHRRETPGSGIGARAYYLRAIEVEKRQLLDALIAAATDPLGPPAGETYTPLRRTSPSAIVGSDTRCPRSSPPKAV